MSRTRIESELRRAYPDVSFDVLTPPDTKLGDYSTNIAFALSKREKKDPVIVAADIAALFGGAEWLDRTEVAPPGFVNFFLKQGFLQKELKKTHEHREHYGVQDIGAGKTVIVEYSSPNIAKPMHIGHLRPTVIGDALANVYEMLGYKVVRWNYIGDWGTQFGKLIAAWKRWGDKVKFEKSSIKEMLRLYTKFHEEAKQDPSLEALAREEFKKLEDGDKENRKIWEDFRSFSLDEFNEMYRRLDVSAFDVTKGESDYELKLKPLIDELVASGVTRESEGALIIELADEGLPPGLLRKSDGATLYLTRDIASLRDRINEYHPAKILYVVANQQTLHFEQLFVVKDKIKLEPTETVHVKFGMVLGEDGKKLATREGNTVPLQEVMDKIIAKARDIVKEKNPELSEEEVQRIADAVGVGALKYNDLHQHPHTDITFDWDAMLDLGGDSGPYLQYTYARLMSILAKATSDPSTRAKLGAGHSKRQETSVEFLVHPTERALMKHLLDFPFMVKRAAELYVLNGIALYLYELANLANRFYENVRVLESENSALRDARLVLIETVAATFGRGMKLLGIQPLERV